jgi:type II secretory pathway pseudopilin PulG
MSSQRSTVSVAGRRAGFSTIGMIVAFVLLGLLLAPMLGTILSAQRSFVASRDRARAAGSVRYAHLALTRFMRLAGSSPVGLPLPGIDPDPGGDGVFNDVRLRADYNPPDGDIDDPGEDLTFFLRADTMFVKTGTDGDEEPFLIGVDSLAFEYLDRDGSVITDPARIGPRAMTVDVTIRARGDRYADPAERTLSGLVRLRNGK